MISRSAIANETIEKDLKNFWIVHLSMRAIENHR